jgi:Ca2+-binding EF-hand superfamily protein
MKNLIKVASFVLFFFAYNGINAQSQGPASKSATLNLPKATPAKTEAAKPQSQSLFAKLDANKDGKITKDEANNSKLDIVIKNFENLDTNKDGNLSKAELKGLKDHKKFDQKEVKREKKQANASKSATSGK